jgi:hypothetical protein
MDYSDFQFGNIEPEFDLTPDITGTTIQPPLKEKPSDTGLPDNFWFQNYSSTSLVNNNELPGKADDKFSDTVRLNEHRQVFNKVYFMAMRNIPALELESALKRTFTHKDFNSNSFLRYSLFFLPMVGPIFWSCWPYRTEEEARIEMNRRKELKPIYVSECSRCNTCQYKNSISLKTVYCSKLGLPIFNNDFNGLPPIKVISHLRLAGYLTDTKKDYSWDDVRTALIIPHDNQPTRTYANYVTPKEVAPGARFRKGIRELNKMRYDAQEQLAKDEKNRFFRSVCYPLIIKIQESILRNRQNDLPVNNLIRQLLLPEKQKHQCQELIYSLKSDPLLWAGIRCYLPVYKKCDDALMFFKKINRHVPFAVQRAECTHCTENKNGFCIRLECRLLDYTDDTPAADRIQAIEFIGNDRKITNDLIEHCKNIERSDPHAGLSTLHEIINSCQSLPVYNGAGLQDLNTLAGAKLSDNSTTEWITNKIKNDSSVIRIETAIKKISNDKKATSLLQDSILLNKTRPSDNNELCLTRYSLDPEIKLPRLKRCNYCTYATILYCKKYNKQFIESIKSISPEIKEIVNCFSKPPLQIDIDPVQTKKPIEVELENPGNELSIDLLTDNNIDDNLIWSEAQLQEIEVETPAAVEFDSQLDVDIGENAEGMVLDDSLI